jgi:hypothetical protein
VFSVIFQFLTIFNTIIGAGAVGAGAVGAGAVGTGAALRYGSGSGSYQMIRLLAAPEPEPNNFDSVAWRGEIKEFEVKDYKSF